MNAPAEAALIRQHLIDPEICIRCNTCESICPVGAITHDSRNYVVKADVCNFCMDCISPCPTGSIDNWRAVPVGRAYSIEEQFSWEDLPGELTPHELVAAGAEPATAAAAPKPAEYWWNTTNNDAYAVTWYAGFLKVGNVVGVQQLNLSESIFDIITPNEIHLNKTANVAVYNILGSKIMEKKEVLRIDLSGLKTGVYIIRANNESLKVVH